MSEFLKNIHSVGVALLFTYLHSIDIVLTLNYHTLNYNTI